MYLREDEYCQTWVHTFQTYILRIYHFEKKFENAAKLEMPTSHELVVLLLTQLLRRAHECVKVVYGDIFDTFMKNFILCFRAEILNF